MQAHAPSEKSPHGDHIYHRDYSYDTLFNHRTTKIVVHLAPYNG